VVDSTIFICYSFVGGSSYGFGRDAVFTPTSVMDHASVKLNDCMDARQHCMLVPASWHA